MAVCCFWLRARTDVLICFVMAASSCVCSNRQIAIRFVDDVNRSIKSGLARSSGAQPPPIVPVFALNPVLMLMLLLLLLFVAEVSKKFICSLVPDIQQAFRPHPFVHRVARTSNQLQCNQSRIAEDDNKKTTM